MRLRNTAVAALGLALCGLLVVGVTRWIEGAERPTEALELEAPEARAGKSSDLASLAADEEFSEALSLPTALVDRSGSAPADERLALGESSSLLRVLVRAADSAVELVGADVRAISRVHQQAFEGFTGEDGILELEIPAGAERVDLVIAADGYVTASVPSIDFASGEHTQEMISAATIEGYVQERGGVRAVVQLWNESLRLVQAERGREAELGPDSHFRFEGLRPGGYALGLELDGRGIDFVANVVVGAGDTESVNLRAPRPAELDLRIVRLGEGKEPVPEASVKLIPDRQGVPRAMESRVGQRSGKTDENGRWRVPGLSPGEWIVEASDGAAKVRRRIEVEGGGRISRVEIAMAQAPALIVRLRGTGGLDPSKLDVFAEKLDASSAVRRAEPRPDGSFYFPGLPPHERLRVRAGVRVGEWEGEEKARPTRTAYVRLRPRAEPYELELQLAARCTATVVVEKSDGSPWELGARLAGQGPGQVGPDGAYVFVLPAGPALLEVGGRDGTAKTRKRVVIEPGEENRFEVTLRSVSRIRGIYTDTNGAALARLRVRARRQDVEEGQRRDFTTRTDAFGAFELDNLPPGEFLLTAITRYGETGAESARATFVTPRDSGARFSLVLPQIQPESPAVGILLGRATTLEGERVSRFRVQNLRGGTVSVDGDRFEIRDLRSGRFNLTLVADGCLPRVLRGVELAAGATIDLGTVEFAPSTRVIVDVRGSDNRSLAEARVELRTRKTDLQPGQRPARHRIRDRRRDGRYQREKLPRGRFELIVRREGYETYRRNVTVREQPRQLFRLKLKKQDSNG